MKPSFLRSFLRAAAAGLFMLVLLASCVPLVQGVDGSEVLLSVSLPPERASISDDAAVLSVRVSLRDMDEVLFSEADLQRTESGSWTARLTVPEGKYGFITFAAQVFGGDRLLYEGSAVYLIPETPSVSIPVQAVPSERPGAFTINLDVREAEDADAPIELSIPRGESGSIQLTGDYVAIEWELNGQLIAGATEALLTVDTSAAGFDLAIGQHDITVYATDADGYTYAASVSLSVSNEIYVLLNGNGGQTLEGESSLRFYFAPGFATALPETAFQKEGYRFIGWSTADSGATEYAPAGLYSALESGTELNARWLSESYTDPADFECVMVGTTSVRITTYIGSALDVNIPPFLPVNGLYYPVTWIGFDGGGFWYPVGAFQNTPITSVVIPDTLRYIGENSFNGCIALQSVHIPASIISILRTAFNGCSALTELYIPASVRFIYPFAFTGLSSLPSITVDPTSTYFCSVDGVLYDAPQELLTQYPSGKTDTTYTVSEGVLSIESGAFAMNTHITSLELPSTMEYIGDAAFYACTQLTSLTLLGAQPPTLGAMVFDGLPEGFSITVPAGSLAAYQAAAGWSTLSVTIVEQE